MGGWRLAIWVILVGITLAFLYMVRGILLPFAAALIISVLLDPTVRKLRMRGYPRSLAIGLVFLAFFGVLIGIGAWLTPVVSNQLANLRSGIANFSNEIGASDPNQSFYIRWNPVVRAQGEGQLTAVDKILSEVAPYLDRMGLPANRRGIVDEYILPYQQEIAEYVERFFQSLFGALPAIATNIIFVVITPMLVWYMLVDLDRLKRRGALWIPPQIRDETLDILRDIARVFENYLRGVTLAILGYMTGASIVLSILGAPYGVLLGILFGAIYLIPFLGALTSLAILFLATGLSGKESIVGIAIASPWTAAAIVALIYAAFDRTYDMMVYPRVVGKSVGLNPIVSFFVVLSGGALFGLLGMILAFPLAGAVKVVLDRIIRVTTGPAEQVSLPALPLRHRITG